MKILMFLGALAIVGLIATGAITLHKSSNNNITTQIDRAKVKEEASHVVNEGEELLQEARAAINKASDEHEQK